MKPIEQPHYSWESVPPVARERIEAGEHALERIDRNETFHDWHAIGAALVEMQAEAMRQAWTNRPIGKGYNAAWAGLADRFPNLAKVDKATRSHAIWMSEHWDVIEEWHANLPTNMRRLINHPATVHRRFDRDHPLPRKTGTPMDEAFELDDSEIDDDGTEAAEAHGGESAERDAFDLGERPSPPPPETREDWLRAVDAAWEDLSSVLRRGRPQWRVASAKRILWDLGDLANEADEDDETAEIADDVDREIAAHESREVRATVQAVVTMRHGEPTAERLAQVVAEAEANPLPEGADIFAGLGDEVGVGQVSAERVLARRPRLGERDARIIAARLNHPDSDDQTLAQYAGADVTRMVVRRVLNANGFRRQ